MNGEAAVQEHRKGVAGRFTTGPRRRRVHRSVAARLVLSSALVATLLSVAVAPPAAAHGGDPNAEGYVIVQQALSYLVNDMGTTQASAKIDAALAASDQDGVDVAQVQQAKAALGEGRTDQARALLQDSVREAVAGLTAATGEETGTSLVLAPLASRSKTAADWTLLGLSLLVVGIGAFLSYHYRPRRSLRELTKLDGTAPGTAGGQGGQGQSSEKSSENRPAVDR